MVPHLTCVIVLAIMLVSLAILGVAFSQTFADPTTVPTGTPGAGQYELDERTARIVQAVVQELRAERGGSWFDRHNTAIFTLVGVIIGAVATALLAWLREIRRDAISRRALAGALYQELLQLAIQCYGGCDQMAAFLERPGEPQTAGMDISLLRNFKLPRPTIFEESSSHLGMLPGSLVQRIIAFYCILAFSRDDVDRWKSEPAAHTISRSDANIFASRWFQLCRLAADALQELCRYLRLPKAANPANLDQDLVTLLREKASPHQELEAQE